MGYSSTTNGYSDKRDIKMKTYEREIGICFFCEQPVYKSQEIFNFALDRPIRIDLPVHRSCYKYHRDKGDIKSFLQGNLLDYLEKYDEEENVKEKATYKRKKTRS